MWDETLARTKKQKKLPIVLRMPIDLTDITESPYDSRLNNLAIFLPCNSPDISKPQPYKDSILSRTQALSIFLLCHA